MMLRHDIQFPAASPPRRPPLTTTGTLKNSKKSQINYLACMLKVLFYFIPVV
jgi:hypothetical protein